MFVDEVVHVMDVFAEMAEDGRAQRCIFGQNPKKLNFTIKIREGISSGMQKEIGALVQT